MGQRGPKPSPNSATRHKPAQRRRDLTAETPGVPELVGDYLPQTLAWWEAWVSAPQTSFFAGTDWQTLLRLAPLVDAFFTHPTAQLAAEIRQTEAKLGATAADRDRLGWKIDAPVPESVPGVAASGHRSRPDPRKAGA